MTRSRQPKWLLVSTAILVLCGLGMIAAGYRTRQLANSLPRMTCDDLLRQGRAAPQFLTLTDVRLGQRGHAFRRDMDAAMEMYVPIFSATLKQPPPAADLALLLEVLDDRDRNRLLERPEVGELNVELWTDAASLDPWVTAQLSNRYAGIQIAKCRVVSVGLHEPSFLRAESELHEGVALVLLAIAGQLGWWMWQSGLREKVRTIGRAGRAVRAAGGSA